MWVDEQARPHLGHIRKPWFISPLILIRVRCGACLSPCIVVEVQQVGVRILQELVERRVGLSEGLQFLPVALDLLPEALFPRPAWLTAILLACSCKPSICQPGRLARNMHHSARSKHSVRLPQGTPLRCLSTTALEQAYRWLTLARQHVPQQWLWSRQHVCRARPRHYH